MHASDQLKYIQMSCFFLFFFSVFCRCVIFCCQKPGSYSLAQSVPFWFSIFPHFKKKKALSISLPLPLPTPHHPNFVKCSLYRWDRGWGPGGRIFLCNKQPQELMELFSEVVFFFFFPSLNLQHFDLHTNNNYCSVCQYTWVHLDQARANYGQEAICCPLGFLIWPAQLEEMVLT